MSEPTPVSALRATAHPLRLRMLSLLTNNRLSASDLARELGTTTANASYHLRFLARAGLVVEDGETRIRGGVAKLYTHPWEASVASGDSTAEDRAAYMRLVAQELVRRSELRDENLPMYAADAELWVSEEVRDEVSDLLTRAAHLLHERAGAPRAPGAVPVSLTSVLFTMDPARTTEGTSAREQDPAQDEEQDR
ncbi:MAG: ArsR/SmtB family transcription factor [Nocardioides sp.]|uniref:ArsR/SmtB family transcription factor n=1 Tax=Nocardioides sp. TaxID=35761 RepID=UPI003EFC0952